MGEFPIEFQLLLLCSSYFSDKEKFIEFKKSHQIDWTLFLSLVQRHRVLPMVCHNFYRWNMDVPIKNDLKIASLQHSKQALQQTALLLEINKLFQDNGIECVHFKGPTLSYLLYQDASLRQYKDIDVLIERKNIEKATNLLIKNGFSLKTPLFKKNYLNVQYQLYQKEHLFEKYNCQIELHWSLFNILNDNINDSFFSNKKTITLNSQGIAIFDEAYYLSYLILHGYYSGWARLHWLIDIIDFIKTRPTDWQKIKNIIDSFGYNHVIDEIIELLFLLFAMEKPISNKVPKKILKNSRYLLKIPLKNTTFSPYVITLNYRKFILAPRGIMGKFVYLKAILATSHQDWKLLPLPKPLFFLYYPLRPVLFIIRKIRKI